MSDSKKEEAKVETGFVVLKFIKVWGSKKKGDEETYHMSTAQSLIKKKVAEVKEKLYKYVPKQVTK